MSDIGHNNPPEFDRLSLRKDELLAGMNKFYTDFPDLNTQELCDRAADFKGQLIALRKEVDDAFDVEKRPWLDGAKAVDDKWRMIKAVLPTQITAVQTRLTEGLKFLSDQREKERLAAQEKLRLEQEAADKLKREVEELQQKADAGELVGSGVDIVLKQEQAIQASQNVRAASKQVTALKGNAKAGTGAIGGVKRSAGLRPTYTAVIVKPRTALMHFADDPRILEVLQTVANAKVREIMAGKPEGTPAMPPGIELKTELSAV